MIDKTPLSMLLKDKGSVVHSINPQESCFECVEKLNKLNIGALVVMENDKVMGIVSERDIVRKIVGCGCDPRAMKIEEIMTKNLLTVSPETTVQEAMHIVTDKRFRHLPVISKGRLCGVISIGDLTRWAMLAQEKEIDHLTNYIQGK